MSDSEETLKQEPTLADVMKAVAELSERLGKFEQSANSQFEAIRQSIVDNAIRFDRLESQIYATRSDISAIKADMKEAKRELV